MAVDGNGSTEQHPAWCSPKHCFVTEDGVRVHEQAPARWEDHEAEVRWESRLLGPADDEHTYVELSLENLRLTWWQYHGILPVEAARRIRDQLTEHLNAAQGGPVSEHPEPEDGIHLLVESNSCGTALPVSDPSAPAAQDDGSEPRAISSTSAGIHGRSGRTVASVNAASATPADPRA